MMPSKNKGSNIILWWLIIMPISYVLLSDIFDPKITYGEIIGLFIAIPAGIYGIWKVIDYVIYRIQPFKFWFQDKSPYRGKPPLKKQLTINTGETEIHLKVKPKRPSILGEVHLRLLDSKNWGKSSFPERDVICIATMRGEGLVGNEIIGLINDNTNGLQGRYKEPHHCAPEKPVHIYATVIASKEWDGFLVLQTESADGHFRSRYRRLLVKVNEVV